MHENLPDEAARSKVTVLRDDIEPGSEAQIDYGFLGQWINPTSGKRHRIWAFVMMLPASRHMFVRPVTHMDQHAWTLAHAEAFRFFGGVPRRLLPDNPKTGVDKPDPQLNPARNAAVPAAPGTWGARSCARDWRVTPVTSGSSPWQRRREAENGNDAGFAPRMPSDA
ncbi:DDE-type integrase/transposase/recombinase [Streptomyces sp. DSM 40750]|uniref:DDE-type integrase/transposase/recombinase n=1 Tax=Streptomyces sp. DSM 40750 TaxID=2801030 RepID=UPI00214C3020|nr:DDE-type integrase/transposase/recombinase [Streptomyces sp. DSM 40750]UUU18993.1 DDE-type integrase/transposase/recombinase [Streptomyces sp. DSM 40750]UUU27665.1 DDE-type integrase/transposase/recombinase [Streptomyces sp. DSM 40750]